MFKGKHILLHPWTSSRKCRSILQEREQAGSGRGKGPPAHSVWRKCLPGKWKKLKMSPHLLLCLKEPGPKRENFRRWGGESGEERAQVWPGPLQGDQDLYHPEVAEQYPLLFPFREGRGWKLRKFQTETFRVFRRRCPRLSTCPIWPVSVYVKALSFCRNCPSRALPPHSGMKTLQEHCDQFVTGYCFCWTKPLTDSKLRKPHMINRFWVSLQLFSQGLT